jgi:two-component system, OmpR family, sensor histidine kinase QseC
MMRSLWQPTLVRRVFLSLLAASLVIWTVMMAINLSVTLSDERTIDEVSSLTGYLAEGLAKLDSDDAARAFVYGAVGETRRGAYNWRNFKSLKFQLRDRSGKVLASNLRQGEAALPGEAGNIVEARYRQQRYLVARGESARWTVNVGLPMHDLFGVLRDDWLSLTLDILIAFPLVFIPVWIAVSRGLQPLKLLSDRLAARGADELAPVGVDPKYAEMKPLVAALDTLMLQLQNKISREHAFVHDAAHELRTPIAVISAQAHVLSMASGPGERLEAERQMDLAVARGAHLIHQLLDLARLDGKPSAGLVAIDVAQLVRTDLAQRVQAARARGLELSFDAPDALPFSLEPQAFRSVLHNLVDNALRYVQDGGRVVVELAMQDGDLVLAVADDGPGIAAAEQSLVFERFYRGAANDAPGAGLGLAIARQAAAGMNGEIVLLPGLDGRGCRFVLRLRGAATRA